MPGFKVRNLGSGPSGQPQAYLTYTWAIPTLFAGPNGSGSNGDQFGVGSGALIYLRDATLPTFTVTKEQVQGASLEYKFAKSVSWDDVKITWYDTLGLLSKMKKWRMAVWDVDTGLKPASAYKLLTSLHTFLPTDDAASVNNWNLINSWPSTIKYGDLTYTQSDIKLVDITVTYDWAVESGQ